MTTISKKTLEDIPVEDRYVPPTWDEYYMSMVLLVATKSKDTSTKCGSILVDKDNRVLSIGYNAPYRGLPDDAFVIERPDKYHIMLHGEENALLNYSGARSDMEGSTMYITGQPCTRCLRMMIQSGVKRLVYNTSRRLAILDSEDGVDDMWQLMVDNANIEIVEEDFDERVNTNFAKAMSIMEDRKQK
jgi:dCMP deaminase